jgi:Rps23 Pro-64 3,4-dihydroxylase Tpa1-like proline 4-hydroxylase
MATTVNDNDYRPASRHSQAIYLQDLKPLANWFFPQVSNLISENYARLGLSEEPSGKAELQLTRHGHDCFFLAHRDTTGSGKYGLRRLTFVYYFFQEPRAFSGGDLLLFDEPSAKSEQRQRYVRYCPANNELLLFPSQAYHQVTPVHSDSKDFLSGRFTLNGWYSAAG